MKKSYAFSRFAVIAMVSCVAPGAYGLTIVRNFTGGTAHASAVGAGTLQTVFNAAADCWEHHIRDTHTVTLSFSWGAQTGGVLGAHSLGTQGGTPHRETAGSIVFDNDGSSVFYMDGTPLDSSEWSTLTTSTGNFGGGTLTSGREYSGASGLAVGRFDLFSVAMHEIGHALGLSFANTAFTAENSNGFVDITAPLPFAGSKFATSSGSAHLNISSALMFPSFSAGTRKGITDVDILANAQISQFRNLDFSPCAVPEPTTMALAGMSVAAYIRKRKAAKRV